MRSRYPSWAGRVHRPCGLPELFAFDSVLADRLAADLHHAGHACWLDTNDIPGGEVWLAAIADGIERAHAFVTLVTEAANQ